MAYLLDIATAVPEHAVSNEQLVEFYSQALGTDRASWLTQKLRFLSERTKIEKRHSCIPDFNLSDFELFNDGNFDQPVEKRTQVYKDKIMPLASKAIDQLLLNTKVSSADITHLITVSCTGLFTPGFEFLVSEHYGLQHSEKLALNFLGCYAAVKALKHAKYIADANPNSCILIISAELCSLHFLSSVVDEDIIANLLFADGAAATLICGDQSKHLDNNIVLKMDDIGSAYIPNTLDLMTWNISSSAFKMYLDKNIVSAIKYNIYPVVSDFLAGTKQDYWAIHPGGVRIVDAVKDSLGLTEADIEDSMSVLRNFGNMSSPTILFVLKNILTKIRDIEHIENKNIFCCAFGPGLSIELIRFSSVDTAQPTTSKLAKEKYAVEI